MEKIVFSVLIATYNRKNELRRAVESVLRQTYQKYEIIIVDQSDELNDDIKNLDFRIRYFHISRAGLSRARNVGIPACSGEYICLLDDDAYYDSNFLELAYEVLLNDNVQILSGRIEDPINHLLAQRWMKNKSCSVTIFNSFKYCMSSAMIIKKKVFIDAEFDERFGIGGKYGSGEETDIVIRTIENGERVLFIPQLIVYHNIQSKEEIDLEKAYSYAIGEGAVLKKHSYDIRVLALYYKTILKHFICILIRGNKLRKYYQYILRGEIEGFRRYIK